MGRWWRRCTRALDGVDLDPGVRVVVIRGAGKDFCAGADLEELLASADRAPAENERDALRLGTLLGRLRTCPRPVVALVTGRALAGGAGHRDGVRPGPCGRVGAAGISRDPAGLRARDGDGLPPPPDRGEAGVRPGGDGAHPQRHRGPGGGTGDPGVPGRRVRGGGGRTGERPGGGKPVRGAPHQEALLRTGRRERGRRDRPRAPGSMRWRGRPPISGTRSAAS